MRIEGLQQYFIAACIILAALIGFDLYKRYVEILGAEDNGLTVCGMIPDKAYKSKEPICFVRRKTATFAYYNGELIGTVSDVIVHDYSLSAREIQSYGTK